MLPEIGTVRMPEAACEPRRMRVCGECLRQRGADVIVARRRPANTRTAA